MPCFIKPDLHHTRLCIMTCLCLCVYYVVCFFPGCFSRYLRFRSGVVRIRSTTSVCLLHGLVLLPSGISGKMTIPSKSLLSLLASCSALLLFRATYHLPYHASHIAMSASNLFTLPSKPLLGYVTALLSPSYSVVSWRWRWRLTHDGQDDVGISQYLLYY